MCYKIFVIFLLLLFVILFFIFIIILYIIYFYLFVYVNKSMYSLPGACSGSDEGFKVVRVYHKGAPKNGKYQLLTPKGIGPIDERKGNFNSSLKEGAVRRMTNKDIKERNLEMSLLLDKFLYERNFNKVYSDKEKRKFYERELCKVLYASIYMDLYSLRHRFQFPKQEFNDFYGNFFHKFNSYLINIIKRKGYNEALFFIIVYYMCLDVFFLRFSYKNIIVENSLLDYHLIRKKGLEPCFIRRMDRIGVGIGVDYAGFKYQKSIVITENDFLNVLEGFLDFFYKLETSKRDYYLSAIVKYFESRGYVMCSIPVRKDSIQVDKGSLSSDFAFMCLKGKIRKRLAPKIEIDEGVFIEDDFDCDNSNKYYLSSGAEENKKDLNISLSYWYSSLQYFYLLRRSHLKKVLSEEKYPYDGYKGIYEWKNYYSIRYRRNFKNVFVNISWKMSCGQRVYSNTNKKIRHKRKKISCGQRVYSNTNKNIRYKKKR